MTSSGNDSTTPTQKRRVISASSGLPASPAVGVIGSSAMPQIGQLPGPSRTISGCIGQVHSAPCGAAVGGGIGSSPTKRSGSATNRSRQRAPQKKYVAAGMVGAVARGRRVDAHAADRVGLQSRRRGLVVVMLVARVRGIGHGADVECAAPTIKRTVGSRLSRREGRRKE